MGLVGPLTPSWHVLTCLWELVLLFVPLGPSTGMDSSRDLARLPLVLHCSSSPRVAEGSLRIVESGQGLRDVR